MTIFIQYDSDTEQYELWVADNRMRPMPAGGGGRWEFAHATMAEATTDMEKATAYLATLPVKKQSKRELQEAAD